MSKPAFLSGAADVAVQLAMHHLTGAELLIFSRCSKDLRRIADSAFAWRHSLFTIRVSDPTHLRAIPPRSMLRHARFGLCLTGDRMGYHNNERDRPSPQQIERLVLWAQTVDLRELSARHQWQLTAGQWKTLLKEPALNKLESLSLNCALIDMTGFIDEALLLQIAALPLLRSFGVLCTQWFAGLWMLLPVMDKLTALDLTAVTEEQDALAHVTKCVGLRSLRLSQSHYEKTGSCYRVFFTAAAANSLSDLLVLRIDYLFAGDSGVSYNGRRPCDLKEYTRFFASVPQLHSLFLYRGWGLEAILPAMVRAKSLRLLRIDLHSLQWMGPAWVKLKFLTAKPLIALLRSCTDLRCTLKIDAPLRPNYSGMLLLPDLDRRLILEDYPLPTHSWRWY